MCHQGLLIYLVSIFDRDRAVIETTFLGKHLRTGKFCEKKVVSITVPDGQIISLVAVTD